LAKGAERRHGRPVTNRTCNEAQVDAPYRTYGEFKQFASDYALTHRGEANEIPMLAMFCAVMRRELFEKVGPLDEGFEIGMFEDDDYAQRVRAAGSKLFCVEEVFVHHFGQASLGELCSSGEYNEVLETNRRRFEHKWAWNGSRMDDVLRRSTRACESAFARRRPPSYLRRRQ